MALCKLTRMGSEEDVWVNPKLVVAVEPTEGLGTRITMITTEHGTPLVIQVRGRAPDIVKQLDMYAAN